MNLPVGNYQLDKSHVTFLDLESNHLVFMNYNGQEEEFIVSETLSDGALLLIQKNKQQQIVASRHGVYMDEKLLKNNLDASLIKKNKELYKQIFENIYVIFSISVDGDTESSQDLEDIKKSFIFRGGQIFGIGDEIPENCKVLCVSNIPNKGKIFLSCLANKIPIISIGWLQLCVKHVYSTLIVGDGA